MSLSPFYCRGREGKEPSVSLRVGAWERRSPGLAWGLSFSALSSCLNARISSARARPKHTPGDGDFSVSSRSWGSDRGEKRALCPDRRAGWGVGRQGRAALFIPAAAYLHKPWAPPSPRICNVTHVRTRASVFELSAKAPLWIKSKRHRHSGVRVSARDRLAKSLGTKAGWDAGGAQGCVCVNGEHKQVRWPCSRQLLLSLRICSAARTLLILEIDVP